MIKNLIKNFFNSFSIKFKIAGKNNEIIHNKTDRLRKVKINIYGDNNRIELANNVYMHNCYLRIGFPESPVNNCLIKIGKNTTFNALDLQIGESESEINIGSDCMFSFDVEITCTDTHSILDENNNLLNRGKYVNIGSHVWVCKQTRIMKNTTIPDNSIVAQGSIVTKNFDTPNCIIAGNPAKIVKENINWNTNRPEYYLKSENSGK